MSLFNEASLEEAVIEHFKNDIFYDYINGSDLHKELTEVIIEDDFRNYFYLNYANEKVTKVELDEIVNEIKNFSKISLYEANKRFSNLLLNGNNFKRDDRKQKDFHYNLINFDDPNKNIFKIVNQLEIKGNELRIPDIVIYINGLPLVVFELKSAVKENTTIKNAYDQLTIRYRRDIPNLFKYNAFVVISDGVNTKYGSFFSDYDYFYSWSKIEKDGKNYEGIDSLYSLINGLFKKERIIKVIKDYIFLPDKSNKEEKIVCRYPQFFATEALVNSVKRAISSVDPAERGKGGTYFGATGCGKSMTMLFLARQIMKDISLSSPTIILITDRTDLDDQLSKLFLNAKEFIGDKTIIQVETREKLKEHLNNRVSGGVFLTTIQKFYEDTNLLSKRKNIICISDEAHRSQVNVIEKNVRDEEKIKKTAGFAKYLHDSLPNATFVGFTGTPIDATLQVFGDIVDSYTMSQSVRDGITVNIVYEGRAAKLSMDNSKVHEIEKYYEKCVEEGANEYQIEESKSAVNKLEVLIGDPNRIKSLANDIVNHYEKRVEEHATVCGKAMIVCMNRNIAFTLYKEIVSIRPEWAESKTLNNSNLNNRETKTLLEIPMINMVMTSNKDDKSEMLNFLKKYDKDELDRQFKNEYSNFKIAIVVDMWLTGFDCPCLDTMYIDKPLQKHTLIQTISRVNRVYPNKEKGLIVDYFGIRNQMNLALKQYNNDGRDVFEGIDESIKIVKNELELLDSLFRKFNFYDYFNGSPKEKLDCLKRATEFVQISDEIEKRFMANVKRMKSAYNLCCFSERFTQDERDKVYFYSAIRSIIFKVTKGNAPDIHQMNAKVIEMLSEAIKSDGIEEIFSDSKKYKTRTIDIFSKEYIEKINRIPYVNTRIKILAKLTKDAIDEYKKVNKIKGLQFGEKLQKLIDSYNNRQNEKVYAQEVLDNVAEELEKLLRDLEKDKQSFEALGINFEEKAFLDILEDIAKKYNFYDEYIKMHGDQYLIKLAQEIKKIVDDKSKYTDWFKKEDIKAELKVDIILTLAKFKYPPVTQDEVYKEIFEQAENFKKYND